MTASSSFLVLFLACIPTTSTAVATSITKKITTTSSAARKLATKYDLSNLNSAERFFANSNINANYDASNNLVWTAETPLAVGCGVSMLVAEEISGEVLFCKDCWVLIHSCVGIQDYYVYGSLRTMSCEQIINMFLSTYFVSLEYFLPKKIVIAPIPLPPVTSTDGNTSSLAPWMHPSPPQVTPSPFSWTKPRFHHL